MVVRIAAIILILCMVPCYADYSSLTPAERIEVLAALDMAWEYRALLDGAESRGVESIVRVSSGKYRVRVLLSVPKPEGGHREIRRDVVVFVREQPVWPWAAGGFIAGILLGILAAK